MKTGSETAIEAVKTLVEGIGTIIDGGGGEKPPISGGDEKPPISGTTPIGDGEFSGKGTLISSEGKLYKPLESDQIAVGTRLLETLNQGQIGMDLISALSKINGNSSGVGGNQTVSGKIEFGEIKVKVDVPSGVDTAQLERVLNSKDFTGKIMDIVANKTSYYQKQATLEG
jgi:hypothetical protein